jgi:prepilin-type N-terminal cleavage/methylation domain-containing protein
MIYSKQKGFTLIELLVVIAIIGVLSSVILVSLNRARGKARNAAVKSNLAGIRGNAELFYNENNGFYDNVCGDSKVQASLKAASMQGTDVDTNGVCNNDSISWAVSAPLRIADTDGFTHWCIDNGGAAKGEMAALTAGQFACM